MRTKNVKIDRFKKSVLKKKELHKIFGGDGGAGKRPFVMILLDSSDI